jgi:hypothetical protein
MAQTLTGGLRNDRTTGAANLYRAFTDAKSVCPGRAEFSCECSKTCRWFSGSKRVRQVKVTRFTLGEF